MPIPTARTIVHEFLNRLSDGLPCDSTQLRKHLVVKFEITENEVLQRLPSGRESVFANRVRNATYLMRKQGLATFDGSTVKITPVGAAYLKGAQPVASFTATRPTMPG